MKHLIIRDAVGPGCKNNADDIATVLGLLRLRVRETWYSARLENITVPTQTSAVSDAVETVKSFQVKVEGAKKPDGIVSPTGQTILYLGGLRRVGKQIIVDLGEQTLYAYDGATRAFAFDCTSGDAKHPTAERPTLFSVSRKEKTYRSKKYDAQMNYAMFFTSDLKAIHQSNAVAMTSIMKSWGMNYFGSHGCVRLSESHAARLFDWTPPATPIFIDMSREALG